MNKIQIRINELLDKLVSRGVFLGLLVGLLPAALIIYLGHSMWLAPAMIEAEGKEKQVLALKAEVEKGRAVEKSEDEFKREFKKTVELFYDTLPLLPKETELSNVMLSVQSVAARCNVTLTGLNAVKIGQKTPNADKLYEREYPAVVVGNYDDVMRFFLDLSRQTRILIVRDYKVVSASEKQKGARPQVVSVDFSLLAYHAPPTSEYPANIPPNMLPNTTVVSGTNAKTTAQPDAEKKRRITMFGKRFFVIGLFLLISALTIILTAVGGFAVSTAAQAGKPQNPVPPTPVAGISQNLRDELNTAFNPEFPFNFDSVGNPFADRTNISSAQFKTVSPTETGTKVPVLPTVNGIKNIQPSRPINGMPGYQPLPTPSPVPSPVQQVTAATPKTDVNEVARERNRLMRAGGDVGKIAELYSIDDLKPYGTVGTGNRNYVKFYVTSTKDRLTVGIGTRFRDGVIEGISDEGVKFKRSNGESVFSRWIRSTANEKNSATLRVSTNTP